MIGLEIQTPHVKSVIFQLTGRRYQNVGKDYVNVLYFKLLLFKKYYPNGHALAHHPQSPP